MFDTAIIGAGPAGLSAAINLKQLGWEIVWFGSPEQSVKVEKSEMIANYPGLGLVSGPALNRAFLAHREALQLAVTDAMVTNISRMNESYMLLANNEVYEARTVLFAIGAVSAKGYPGEAELLGKGVSYCATCDGFLYKGKTIAVCCMDKRYEHEADYLAGIADKVYLYVPYGDCGVKAPNAERVAAPVRAIEGDDRVERVRLTDQSAVEVSGVFILRSAVAPAALLPGLEMDGPHIAVNRGMETNLPGCYACGDCTGRPYQIAKAVGEGNVAAHSIVSFLSPAAKG